MVLSIAGIIVDINGVLPKKQTRCQNQSLLFFHYRRKCVWPKSVVILIRAPKDCAVTLGETITTLDSETNSKMSRESLKMIHSAYHNQKRIFLWPVEKIEISCDTREGVDIVVRMHVTSSLDQ